MQLSCLNISTDLGDVSKSKISRAALFCDLKTLFKFSFHVIVQAAEPYSINGFIIALYLIALLQYAPVTSHNMAYNYEKQYT